MLTVTFTDNQFAALQAFLVRLEQESEAYLSELDTEQLRNLLALIRGQDLPYPGLH